MLTTLTRKLCPLMTLAIATIGCGKKIGEPKSSPTRQNHNQEIPAAYVIRLDGSSSSWKNYSMPKPTHFVVPDRLKVRSGNAAGKIVEIAHDVNPYDSDDFHVKCTYASSSSSKELVLTGCVDYENDDFGDVSDFIFRLEEGDLIQIRFKGANAADTIVDAVYTMEWI